MPNPCYSNPIQVVKVAQRMMSRVRRALFARYSVGARRRRGLQPRNGRCGCKPHLQYERTLFKPEASVGAADSTDRQQRFDDIFG